jgi:hypothetical protein
VNMSAYFLTCLSGSKDAYYGDFRTLGNLRRTYIITKLRVVLCGRRLIVVDTIQPDPEQVHVLQSSDPSGAQKQFKEQNKQTPVENLVLISVLHCQDL